MTGRDPTGTRKRGTKLDFWIKRAGLKKNSIAQELGVEPRTFTNWISGATGVDPAMLPKIAAILNRMLEPRGWHVDPQDLVNGTRGAAYRPKGIPLDIPALERAIERCGKSKSEIADLARVSRQMLYLYLEGGGPSEQTLDRLAHALGVTPASLRARAPGGALLLHPDWSARYAEMAQQYVAARERKRALAASANLVDPTPEDVIRLAVRYGINPAVLVSGDIDAAITAAGGLRPARWAAEKPKPKRKRR